MLRVKKCKICTIRNRLLSDKGKGITECRQARAYSGNSVTAIPTICCSANRFKHGTMTVKKSIEIDESFIRDRITQLRMALDISEYRMSLDLGHSKGYIQSISSGRSLPSMIEFLAICEYLHVTPAEFFSPDSDDEVSVCNPAGTTASSPGGEIFYLKVTQSQIQILKEIVDGAKIDSRSTIEYH